MVLSLMSCQTLLVSVVESCNRICKVASISTGNGQELLFPQVNNPVNRWSIAVWRVVLGDIRIIKANDSLPRPKRRRRRNAVWLSRIKKKKKTVLALFDMQRLIDVAATGRAAGVCRSFCGCLLIILIDCRYAAPVVGTGRPLYFDLLGECRAKTLPISRCHR